MSLTRVVRTSYAKAASPKTMKNSLLIVLFITVAVVATRASKRVPNLKETKELPTASVCEVSPGPGDDPGGQG